MADLLDVLGLLSFHDREHMFPVFNFLQVTDTTLTDSSPKRKVVDYGRVVHVLI